MAADGSGATRQGIRRAREPGRLTSYVYALVVAAIAVAIGIVVIGPAFGLHTVRLATGSMSPGLPAGSMLVVHDTPAAEVQPGDVVMVQRPDHRPVTHRVVALAPPTAETGGRFVLTMRGDANPTNDPQPYLVDRVGRMVFGIPWGGQLVEFVRSPVGMGVLTMLFSSLVLWVLWPTGKNTKARPIES
ncbi:signal peptidase I [Arthrobacter crystallopoietes]|uniref:signal peptidase I n=1 Tax=Crystallibacter crystallopoietes TaxID=37928 RepID=UPI0011113F9E|nr:signal peptidase I [Arthrobacter crystallopoietes]